MTERLVLDVSVADDRWLSIFETPDSFCRPIVLAALKAADCDDGPKGPVEVSIVLSNDNAVRHLNADYRDADKATNVLSFPLWTAGESPVVADMPIALGDVVLAYETVIFEAKDQEKTVQHHVAHLIVHGVLHLLGLDHIDATEADVMEAMEVQILATLGVPDPYAGLDPKECGADHSAKVAAHG